MEFKIEHELKRRMRVHFSAGRFGLREADTLLFYLEGLPFIKKAKVYERTADAVLFFDADRADVIRALMFYDPLKVRVPEDYIENSGREVAARYYERVVCKLFNGMVRKVFLPDSVRRVLAIAHSLRFIKRGAKTLKNKKPEVELLDAIAIIAAILSGNFATASSVMLLLEIGDMLEEWTHKRATADLARQLSLNISRVWLRTGDTEMEVDASDIKEGDLIVVRMGNLIPFDGTVASGEAMVNQSSMTGESAAVLKNAGKTVYAGCVLEEGELVIRVDKTGGSGRYDRIVKLIEESEKLKSSVESKADSLADALVPYTLTGAALTFLLTGNTIKAVSVLMVDFSCALKLAMPISVLSALREAGERGITVKGGKFLEAVSDADTIIFDKTGTLTKARPTVAGVISFNGESEDELLREAACLEEHFPHTIAASVVEEAERRSLHHEELHTDIEYVVAHGIRADISGRRVVLGSYHFVFEDERASLPEDMRARFDALPVSCSHLYYAKEGQLAAVILIRDPLKEEAASVISDLKEAGFEHVVMMTGDSERTAYDIARQLSIDEYYSEVMPEDKAGYVRECKKRGRGVIMIGDGINDAPALSEADAGIAISEGAQIARQIADITISGDDLYSLIYLRRLSTLLMERIRFNYRSIVSINAAIIAGGLLGIITPSVSALLHNTSTLALGTWSTTPLIKTKAPAKG